MSKDFKKEGKRISPQARSVLIRGRTGKAGVRKGERVVIEHKAVKYVPKGAKETPKPAFMPGKPKLHPIVVRGRVKKYGKKEKEHEKVIEKSLKYTTAECMSNGAGSSIFESYITPFALAIGASNLHVGLISTFRNLASAIGQVPGAILTQYFERKKIAMITQAIANVLILGVIALIPFMPAGDYRIIMLMVLLAFFSFFISLRGPSWSSLLGDIVPLKIRAKYFGNSNTNSGLAGIVATLVVGYLLMLYGFSVIFAIAMVLAVISVIIVLKIYEPPFRVFYQYRFAFSFSISHLKDVVNVNKSLVVFTLFLSLSNFAAEIASPFYVVHMLKGLDIGYAWFSILVTLGALARVVSYKYWAKLSTKFGSRKIFMVCSVFCAFIPLGWILVFNITTVAILKIYEGLVLSGFSLLAMNYLLDVTPAGNRPRYIAYHNLFAKIGIVFGALTGALLAGALQSTVFVWIAGLQILFLLSFVLRFSFLAFLPSMGEVYISQAKIMPVRYVFRQAIAVEPVQGIKDAICYTFRYPYIIEQKIRDRFRKGYRKSRRTYGRR